MEWGFKWSLRFYWRSRWMLFLFWQVHSTLIKCERFDSYLCFWLTWHSATQLSRAVWKNAVWNQLTHCVIHCETPLTRGNLNLQSDKLFLKLFLICRCCVPRIAMWLYRQLRWKCFSKLSALHSPWTCSRNFAASILLQFQMQRLHHSTCFKGNFCHMVEATTFSVGMYEPIYTTL